MQTAIRGCLAGAAVVEGGSPLTTSIVPRRRARRPVGEPRLDAEPQLAGPLAGLIGIVAQKPLR